jgi:hypothetical protein
MPTFTKVCGRRFFWGDLILQSFIGKANRKIVTKKVVRAKGCDIVVNGVGEGGYVPGKEYDIVFSHYITSGKMAEQRNG